MRAAQNPTLRLRSILFFVTALCVVASPVHAQDAPGGDAPVTDEEVVTEEAEEAASAEDEIAEDEIDEATQAEIDAALAEDAPHCSGTGIEGVVRDAQTQETLIEAPVVVIGRSRRVLTDYDGRFAIDLPPGTYSLRSYYDLYQPIRVDDIVVTRGRCTEALLELSADTSTGEEIVIEVRAERATSASQLRMRRESAAVQDAVSSEEMRRAPDSTASEAARRIVGVTMRDDYLFVRGLGGRYVTALMNGVALPQSDPDVPGVQLDVLPSAALESLSVRKTFTADLPGDWAGGLVDVTTQSYPTDFELRVGVTFGVNTERSFRSVLSYERGGLDFLGFDDGTRRMPAVLRDVVGSELTVEQRDYASLQFPNTWGLTTDTSLPNMGLSLSMGDTVDVGGHLLGFRLLAGYRIGERPIADFIQSLNAPGEGELAARETLSQRGSERFVQLGALGTLTFEIDRGHDLTLNVLYSQNAEDFVGRLSGMNETAGGVIDQYRLAWLQRSLVFGQLVGVHRDIFGSARLDWQINASVAERRQPDMRDVSYLQEPDGRYRYSAGPTSGARFYSDLDDSAIGGGLGLTIPIDQLSIRVGSLYRYSDRNLTIRRFNWLTRPRAPADGVYLPPSDLFAAENVNTYLRMVDQTQRSDSYDASQELMAAYVAAEWRPWNVLRLYAGIRGESFRQTVSSFLPGDDSPRAAGTLRTDVDPLPSAGAIVEVTDGVFVRASYGGTVGRPQIRELAPYPFLDIVRRRTVTGRSDLQRTYIHNFDVRVEWFPSASEVLALSVFGKVFESPIEQVITSAEGDASFDNVDGAENFGAELEGRIHFGHFVPGMEWLTFGANVALIYSRARMSPEQLLLATSAERPLAGQAPFVVNIGVGLAPPDTGLTLNLYYNVLGPRLEDVGRNDLPDVYREPFHQLDLTAAWMFTEGFQVRFAAQNILFQRQELRQGEFVVLGINPGAQFSLGLSISN